MQRFFIENGLVIQREGLVLEYLRRSDTSLYFEDPTTGDIQSFAEEQFWELLFAGSLTIKDARATDKELELSPAGVNCIPADLLDEKHLKGRVRKLDYIRGIQQRGITRGQLDQIEIAIPKIAQEIEDSKPPKP